MGALLGVSCKPSSPQKKYTAEARDKLVEAGGVKIQLNTGEIQKQYMAEA